MTTFTNIESAVNRIADVLGLDTDGAVWVYENSDCPAWDADDFADYDFLSDECVSMIPAEFVK